MKSYLPQLQREMDGPNPIKHIEMGTTPNTKEASAEAILKYIDQLKDAVFKRF
jgi:hypothetical protein